MIYEINGGLDIEDGEELFKLSDKAVIKIKAFQQTVKAILRKLKYF